MPIIKTELIRPALVLLLTILGVQQLAGAGLIKAKAQLAPVLINRAWQQSLKQAGEPIKPWPWADTWPVARLRVSSHAVDLPILAGDTGHALAFAPGYSLASAPLGSDGLAVIGGHRDTHFAFLSQLQTGDRLQLQLKDGSWRNYQVAGANVVDVRFSALPTGAFTEMLLLVTCYPFNSLEANGPLRYVVAATPAQAEGQISRF
ncbi:MAG: class GN sortase [Pseudomonadota bacterium]